jgi:chorismate mutase
MNIFLQKKPFLIAGPCGAEDEKQMISIAESFKDSNIDMIRAGVWKPRSKPGFFEGRGEIALQWLQEVKRISGKPVCTEVANQEQVALALKYNIDAVWIGARSSVNPFVVQEIAESLKDSKVAVMIKNPINPDVELWCGAIERFKQYGFESIAAIHRGFSSYDPSPIYRNKPMWALPIELKRRYDDLPILCDASHISGNRTLLQKVAQRAMDLDFNGLMLETHPNPDAALSDAKQQITPARLFEIIKDLHIRNATTTNVQQEIEAIREVLDSLDAEIVDLIGKRMELVKQLGPIKRTHNIPIYQADRWREIIDSRTQWGKNNQLKEQFIFKLFELIHDTSIKTQCEE